MGENSKISWTDHSWNCWIGCTKVSPGCERCYAEADQDLKYHRAKWGKDQPRSKTKTWGDPLKWNKKALAEGERKKVFVNSLSDFFDTELTDEWRNEAIKIMHQCSMLDFLLLTKRSTYMRDYFSNHIMPFNVWPGVTVENQEYTKRIPNLQAIQNHPIKWLSVEPILGEIDLHPYLSGPDAISWVIVGGESGEGARQVDLGWMRYLKEQCEEADVAFFCKQLGENWKDGDIETKTPGKKWDVIAEFPEELRIQQYPI